MKSLGSCVVILVGLTRSGKIDQLSANSIFRRALMAELVDAYDSGSYVRKDVEVQVFLRAPNVGIIGSDGGSSHSTVYHSAQSRKNKHLESSIDSLRSF